MLINNQMMNCFILILLNFVISSIYFQDIKFVL